MKSLILHFLLLTGVSVMAENMFRNGDFQKKGLEFSTRVGRSSIQKEGEGNSNTFARFTIDKIYKNAQGHEVASVNILAGIRNGIGFPCKPDTRYLFSLKMRSSNPKAGIGLTAAQWLSGSKKFKEFRTTLSGGLPITTEWKEYKGSFITDKNATNVALVLSMWWSTEVGPARYKVGDYLDIDDLVIKEAPTLGSPAVPAAGNLVTNSDFSKESREYSVSGCQFTTAVENGSWNQHGRMVINKIRELANGRKMVDAVLYIGGNNQPVFECQPNTKYRFSFRARSSAAKTSMGVKIVESADRRSFANMKIIETSLRGGQMIPGSWKHFSGNFTTGKTAKYAALRLSIWWDTQHGPMRYKEGDTIDIDDVKIEASPAANGFPAPAAAASVPELKIRKAAAPVMFNGTIELDGKLSEPFWQNAFQASDFITFRKPKTAPAANTTFKLLADKDALYIGIVADEPLKVDTGAGKGKNVWDSSAFEIFFGYAGDSKGFLQIAIGANGEKYIGSDAGARRDFESFSSGFSVEDHQWTAEVRVPWTLLKTSADSKQAIPFNIARHRDSKSDYLSWSASLSLQDVKQYGLLIPGGFAPHASRSAYEQAAAKAVQEAARKKQEQLSKRIIAAARVGITSDFTVPYLPDELFTAPLEKIQLRAAVNEIKPLAIAVANPTALMTEYRIVLEQSTTDQRNLNGAFGLKDFPANQITLRRGVAVRDSDKATGFLFDPLVKMDEGSFLTLAGQSAGLVWIDFDTRNVKPGTYTGTLRIIPMNQPVKMVRKGGWTSAHFTSSELKIPVTLRVDPIVLDTEPMHPGFFCSGAESPEQFKLQIEAGQRYFLLTPYYLFPLDKASGTFKPDNPKIAVMNRHIEWAKQYGVKNIKFVLAYSAYYAFKAMYGLKADDDKTIALWKNWLKTLHLYLKNNNISTNDYYIELFDEPPKKNFDLVIKVTRAAKEAVPEMKTLITLGYGEIPLSDLQAIASQVDAWMLWTSGFPDTGYHQKFFKEQQARGKELWHYSCDTQMRSSLDKNYRRNAWATLAYDYNCSGLFQFYYTLDRNGMLDFLTETYGNVAYAPTVNSAIPSIRYMALRQGMYDVKYFALLRKLGKGDPTVEKFIRDSAREIASKTANPNRADELRHQAAEMILKLQRNK
ncbi:MAG: hypothetical protein IJW05_10770 [Lentisphaeria bacterium]|nr:hypothetical protein [Lentisphaeria bacterium]